MHGNELMPHVIDRVHSILKQQAKVINTRSKGPGGDSHTKKTGGSRKSAPHWSWLFTGMFSRKRRIEFKRGFVKPPANRAVTFRVSVSESFDCISLEKRRNLFCVFEQATYVFILKGPDCSESWLSTGLINIQWISVFKTKPWPVGERQCGVKFLF